MLSFLPIILIDPLEYHLTSSSAFLDHFIRLYQVAVTSFEDLLHHGRLLFLLGAVTHHAISLLLSSRFFGDAAHLALGEASRRA